MKAPPRWTTEQLKEEAATSAALFRAERLAPSLEWQTEVDAAKARFERLFEKLGDMGPGKMTKDAMLAAFRAKLGEALRYLAAPPVSADDLKTIANITTIAPKPLGTDTDKLQKVFDVLNALIDPYRFPWVKDHREPTQDERSAALLASSVVLAAQRVPATRRNRGKALQEKSVKEYLKTLDFSEVKQADITTVVGGPQAAQFCGECRLGKRKADGVVPCAIIAGVFKPHNLLNAQDGGLTIFWAHDLTKLGEFIADAVPDD